MPAEHNEPLHSCLLSHIPEMTFSLLGLTEFFSQGLAKEWFLHGNVLQLILVERVVLPSLFLQDFLPMARVVFIVTIFTAGAFYLFYGDSFVERMNNVRTKSFHFRFKFQLSEY